VRNGRTAIGMFSGGLDSILATRIMALEGFDVIALHFYTGFTDTLDRELARGFRGKWEPPPEVAASAADLGVRFLPIDVSGQEYHNLITHPKHGYGSGANPCLDCRAWLLVKAGEVMESEGADFVFTGEVLGQRPMSQQRPHLRFMEKRSGLLGRLLRPLSALLLEPTVPEIEGTVDRGHLYDFHGRSRRPQQELAAKLGIERYPSSGGGCLLADPIFGLKFHELLAHCGGGAPSRIECESLKAGRHIRLPGGLKAVTGRTESENKWLEELFGDEAWMFDARDHSGATVFIPGEPDEEDSRFAAAIAARYSKGKDLPEVTVVARRGPLVREYLVRPASPEEIAPLIVT
jgi:tRNA-uridine 2-sulfurtransferase